MAAASPQTVEEIFHPAKETRGLRLGLGGREFREFRQKLLLALVEVLRRFYRDLNVHVAGLFRPQHRHTLAAQPETAACLRPARNLDLRLAAVDRRHLEIAPQRRRN